MRKPDSGFLTIAGISETSAGANVRGRSMQRGRFNSRWIVSRPVSASALVVAGPLLSFGAPAAPRVGGKPVVERKGTRPPEGPPFLRIEHVPPPPHAPTAPRPTPPA